ncbi:MAG: helix-turn-helix domain-containing protein [Paenisporosarcina sp.]
MYIDEEDYLAHYGILRRSGRYPWGSGGPELPPSNPNKRNKVFLDYVDDLKRQGLSEKEISVAIDCSTTELRAAKSIAKNQQRQANIALAQRLQDKGYSTNAIATRMGIPESTARNLLKPGAADKADVLTSTSLMLKQQVDEKGFIDIGKGVENYAAIGVSATRLNTAVAMLREEGYEVHNVKVKQLGTGHETKMKVLGPPGSTQKEVWQHPEKIHQISDYSEDGGRSYTKPAPPISINQKRVDVVYAEQGGAKADGVIYVRPGVTDVALGGAKYAQVRVQVGDGHYLKGMAMYKSDLPEGVDLQFNTSKRDTGNKLDAMKPLQPDEDLPFGSIVRQIVDKPGTPGAKPTSVMNIVNEEGNWDTWSRTLSSQMLSKQTPVLAKTQLDMTYERRQNNYENINNLTNPTVRKKLLMDFAGETDAAAVHLKAAAMPGQAVKVILPVSTLSPTQVYAPTFKNGERVVLVRHPHGGTFEIPELTVNNNHAESKRLLGDAKDAIGIHHDVAKRLSGADFDGDTVLVIPNTTGRIKTSPALASLKDFDPRSSYPSYEGMKPMRNTQTEMGKISNLITDMSIAGASHDEIARAVKHSMVVIDAEKHNLNYKLSYNDNNIKQLKEKYQRQPGGGTGAATIVSRAKSELRVPERKERTQAKGGPIDKVTGERVYEETGRVHWKSGRPMQTKTTRLAEAKDAHTLSSGTPIEVAYANHSNKLKALANQARLDAFNTPPAKYSPSAKKAYSNEVASLDSKLALAKSNAPLERQAQLVANTIVKTKKSYNPNMDKDTYKKVEYQALQEARRRTGADKQQVRITKEEWDAIQAGAISDSKLTEILTHADMDVVRKLATPKPEVLMTSSVTARARAMLASGYTRSEVAEALGVSVSTLDLATVE